jgi:uncharacterized protein (TIGR03435 family)
MVLSETKEFKIMFNRFLFAAFAGLLVPAAASAQIGPGAYAGTPVVKMFHAAPPLPSYEVESIRMADPARTPRGAMTIKNYILAAYGVARSQEQVVGGPKWLATDLYVVQVKPPDDVQAAMQTMSRQKQSDLVRSMQQSLLADRFRLKAHFETRKLPVLQLIVGKGGLKMKQVPDTQPASNSPFPGISLDIRAGGITSLSAEATPITALVNFLRTLPEMSGTPLVDKTGITGSFDVTGLEWGGPSPNASEAGGAIGGRCELDVADQTLRLTLPKQEAR